VAEVLRFELARLLRWQSRALPLAGALLVLGCVHQAAALLGLAGTPGGLFLRLALALVALAALALWLALLGFVFRTGQAAFGTGAALVYLVLAALLFLWPGLYVIPHMLRLDIRRLHGVEPEGGPEPPGGAGVVPRMRE
jgi:hypothetical protein